LLEIVCRGQIRRKGGIFKISVKPLPALAKSAKKSRTFFIHGPGEGGAAHDFLWFGLLEHSGFSGENLFTDTCSSHMQFLFLFKQAASKVKLS
jgi:hypothetical protein